jgi:hypothetical protein
VQNRLQNCANVNDPLSVIPKLLMEFGFFCRGLFEVEKNVEKDETGLLMFRKDVKYQHSSQENGCYEKILFLD